MDIVPGMHGTFRVRFRNLARQTVLSMFIAMAVVFVLGYLAIALEHPLRVNKSASAILTGAVVWSILLLGRNSIFEDPALADHHHLIEGLLEHLGEIASILFFLMGAMTIVELVDVHEGFRVGVPSAGRWRERLNTDSAYYGGSNVGTPLGAASSQAVPFQGRAQSIVLSMPPLATVFFEWTG